MLFLKIAEGCDKRCTYCIIPYLRGHYRSVPMEQLVKEARQLAESRREGADSGGAGNHPLRQGSLRGEDVFLRLLKELAKIPGI